MSSKKSQELLTLLEQYHQNGGGVPLCVTSDGENFMVLSVSDAIRRTFADGFDSAIEIAAGEFPSHASDLRLLFPKKDPLEGTGDSPKPRLPRTINAAIEAVPDQTKRCLLRAWINSVLMLPEHPYTLLQKIMAHLRRFTIDHSPASERNEIIRELEALEGRIFEESKEA